MNIVDQYRKAKADYDSLNGQIGKLVKTVFAEYQIQKHKVSTRVYKKWLSWRVDAYKIQGSKIRMEIGYAGLYGYYENQTLSLPVSTLIAAQDGPEALTAAIAERIKAEGEDIARREKKAAQKQVEAQFARRDELQQELAALDEELKTGITT